MRATCGLSRRLWLLIGVTAAIMAFAASSASALTEAGAASKTQQDANEWWGPGEIVQYCTGPYENVKGKTQWACYGYDQNSCVTWQINVDPYGTWTYRTHGCPA